MNRRTIVLTVALVLVLSSYLSATPIRVDFSVPNHPDAADINYQQWTFGPCLSDSKAADIAIVTVTKVGDVGTNLKCDWWKDGMRPSFDAKLVNDGIMIPGANKGGGKIEMRINGLPPGPHTMVTYHNAWQDTKGVPFGKMNILVDGVMKVAGLAPSSRVKKNSDAAFACFEVTAQAGKDIVILFESDSTDTSRTNHNVVLNGFEIDTRTAPPATATPAPATATPTSSGSSGNPMFRERSSSGTK